MSSAFTRAASISYKAFATSFGAGTLQVINWNDYATARATVQAIRSAGGEVLQYCEPPRWTPNGTGICKSFYVPGATYTVQAAQAAGWMFGGVNHTTLYPRTGYPGAYAGDIRGSVSGGTAYMRHIVEWCCDRMNDPLWELDGFFLDSVGDMNMSGGFTGWVGGEAADFDAGARLLVSMLRTACGPDVILLGNDYWSQTTAGALAARTANGMVNEHNDSNPNQGAGFLYNYYAQALHPKRRLLYIANSDGGALAAVGHPFVTHITVRQFTGSEYIVSSPAGTLAGIGNGAWPADALHIQGWKSINAGASPTGATGVPINPGGGGGTPTVTVSPTSASVQQGTTLQLTGVASDGSTLTWSVAGGATKGTVNSSGLYTAPASVPGSACVVTATNPTGQSASASLTITTTPQTPPTKPTIPTGFALEAGNGTITVTWAANPTADQVTTYQVYVNDLNVAPSNLAVGNVLTYLLTGLTNDTPYSVRVSARNAIDFGDWTSPLVATPRANITPPADTTPPQSPTTTWVSNVEGLNVTVAYGLLATSDPAERQTTLIIRKSGTAFGPADLPGVPGITTVATFSPGASGQYVDTVPGAGVYFYRLVLFDAAGNRTIGPYASATVDTTAFTPARFFSGSFAGTAGDKPDVALWRDPDVTRTGVTVGSLARLDGAGLITMSVTPSTVGVFGRLGVECRVPFDLTPAEPRWVRMPLYCAAGSSLASTRVMLCGTPGLADPNTSAELLRFKQVGTQLLVERRTGGGAITTMATLTAPTATLYNLDLLLTATTLRLRVNGADVNLGAGVGVAVAHGVALSAAYYYGEGGNDLASAHTAKVGPPSIERSTPSTPTGVIATQQGGTVIYDCALPPTEDGVVTYEFSIPGLGVQATGSALPLSGAAPAARSTPYVVELATINDSPF